MSTLDGSRIGRSIRVAAVQLRAHDRADFGRVEDAIVLAAADAAARAELVVLPEGTFPAYVLGDAREASDAAGVEAAVGRLCNLARDTNTVIVAGVAVRDADGVKNAAVVIDRDGSLAGRADKLFLWHFDRLWFEAGVRLTPVPTAIGTLGVLICADGRLPTISRTLVDLGAELLVMPTAWVTSGRNPDALENVQADLLARVRAFENNVPFVAANKCGIELEMVAYCGKSQIVDANGEMVAVAGEHEPETLVANLFCALPHPHRAPTLEPQPRNATLDVPVRIAISCDPLPADARERLRILEDAFALTPIDDERLGALDRVLPTVVAGDDLFYDPGGLVSYRRAGYRLAIWSQAEKSPWIERIARARALELRLYVVVFEAGGRAFAVDPDGVIVAGTFNGYRLASFVLDPRKTSETEVAPGTDIAEGIERVAAATELKGAPAP
ncbi:MAG: carbon-nitrogen hydrolase family protein [Candidatus Eremiobacteraeota bacterium]|nr:carbon-nitrogen hydrolase family protein [Candidatus Eremiobacteraeota bacterium]